MKIALTIAGSDSIGGAGVQMDLKAFASLGVHGCSVVTCVTAQNTKEIKRVDAVPADMVRAQIEAVLDDMPIGATKTGAIYTAENCSVIADLFSKRKIPLIIDPVLVATTGYSLATQEYLSALKGKLIPICALITPNTSEAESITGISVADTDSAAKAAESILSLGASGVLVKGIQEDDKITDFLLMADGSSQILSSTRWPGKFHGTGCMLSALIAGHVSLGDDVCTAVVKSRGDVFAAIEKARTLGKGIKMIEPLGKIHREAMKIEVIDSLEEMRHVLESDVLASLLPEVGSNLAYSLPAPLNESEVAGFTGRIVREGKRSRVVGCARFGASKHVARIVISASMNDLAVRSAMNIKYNEANLEACKKAGLSISSFSRKEEPEGVSSMSWGTDSAIKKRGSVPDIIWDEGGMGKEPMIRILGRNPKDIVSKVKRISDNFGK